MTQYTIRANANASVSIYVVNTTQLDIPVMYVKIKNASPPWTPLSRWFSFSVSGSPLVISGGLIRNINRKTTAPDQIAPSIAPVIQMVYTIRVWTIKTNCIPNTHICLHASETLTTSPPDLAQCVICGRNITQNRTIPMGRNGYCHPWQLSARQTIPDVSFPIFSKTALMVTSIAVAIFQRSKFFES